MSFASALCDGVIVEEPCEGSPHPVVPSTVFPVEQEGLAVARFKLVLGDGARPSLGVDDGGLQLGDPLSRPLPGDRPVTSRLGHLDRVLRPADVP